MSRIGVDVGGVIIDKANDKEDTSLFGSDYVKALPVAGAIEAVSRLNKEVFPGEVYIVSKCGEKIEARTREWMKANLFHEKTGVPVGRFHFCRHRGDKAPIARSLKLTHFIDDRLEVLDSMRGVVPNRILFSPYSSEMKRWILTAGPTILVFSWKDTIEWLAPQQEPMGDWAPMAESLKNFFISRQEFESARAVVALRLIIDTGEAESDEPFVAATKAKDQMIDEQRFDEAANIRDLLMRAKKSIEKK